MKVWRDKITYDYINNDNEVVYSYTQTNAHGTDGTPTREPTASPEDSADAPGIEEPSEPEPTSIPSPAPHPRPRPAPYASASPTAQTAVVEGENDGRASESGVNANPFMQDPSQSPSAAPSMTQLEANKVIGIIAGMSFMAVVLTLAALRRRCVSNSRQSEKTKAYLMRVMQEQEQEEDQVREQEKVASPKGSSFV